MLAPTSTLLPRCRYCSPWRLVLVVVELEGEAVDRLGGKASRRTRGGDDACRNGSRAASRVAMRQRPDLTLPDPTGSDRIPTNHIVRRRVLNQDHLDSAHTTHGQVAKDIARTLTTTPLPPRVLRAQPPASQPPSPFIRSAALASIHPRRHRLPRRVAPQWTTLTTLLRRRRAIGPAGRLRRASHPIVPHRAAAAAMVAVPSTLSPAQNR